MSFIEINHITKIEPDILIISTANGLFIKNNAQEIQLLSGVYISKCQIVETIGNNVKILIQGRNSCYFITLNTIDLTSTSQFLFLLTQRITSTLLLGNNLYFGKEISEGTLSLGQFNTLSNLISNIVVNSDNFESIIAIFSITGFFIFVTKDKLIKFDTTLNISVAQIDLPLTISAEFIDNRIYLGTINNEIKIFDSNLGEVQTIPFSGVAYDFIKNDTEILVSSSIGLIELDPLAFSLSSVTTDITLNCVILNQKIYVNLGQKIKNITDSVDIVSFVFDRNSLINLTQGFYRSKSISIATNNETVEFSWEETGVANNFQISLATTQSTDLINFSEYSNPSTSNTGVFVPNITPLTQAVGFELFITLSSQILQSPEVFSFDLTTNEKPNVAANPINLVLAETLVTHTSYPQKFFDRSQVIRKHDQTFKKLAILDNESITDYENAPYGFDYEFKSQVRDKFGRYSKESYNPFQLDYTKKSYPLSVIPVTNINFTVLNPSEIFVDWDPANQLIDGTSIPTGTLVTYKILRKDDSNSIYKTIYADNLISLNDDYITSVTPINDDFKQLTDGLVDSTHIEENAALIFIEPVDITFSLIAAYTVDKIILSFIKRYVPSKIQIQIIDGNQGSSILTLTEGTDYDFTLDQENIQEITIGDLGLKGDKLKISLEPNTDTEIIKITEVEIYRGFLPSQQINTYYRDLDINFKDGSQYYYIVQAQLSRLVTPTNFAKETQTIQVGQNIILGLTDATDKTFRLSINQSNEIQSITEQEKLPVKLMNLSSVLLNKNVVTLGGRFENSASNLASNLTFFSEINGGILTEIIGTNDDPFNVITAVNDELKLSIDKKPIISIFLTPGFNTAAQIAFTINQQLGASVDYGLAYNTVASFTGRRIKLSRPRTGLFDRIKIENGSANQLLGFTNKNLNIFRPRTDLRSNKAYHTSWFIGKDIFVFGGIFDTINNLPTNEILQSPVSDDFISFSLFSSVAILPKNLYGQGQGSKDNYVYITGGATDGGALNDEVYLNSYNSLTRQLTGWIPLSNLPVATVYHVCQVVGNFIYIIGGQILNGTSLQVVKDIYRAEIDINYRIGSWTNIGQIPQELYLSSSVVSQNKIFVIGGKNKNKRLQKTAYGISFDGSGDIIDITTELSLPITISSSTAVIKDNEIYLVGGEINAGFTVGQEVEIQPPNNNI